MKTILKFLICFSMAGSLYGQTKMDSLFNDFLKSKGEAEMTTSLDSLTKHIFLFEKSDVQKRLMQEVTKLRLSHQEKHADHLELRVIMLLYFNGDYTNSLLLSTNLLEKFKKRNDSLGIIMTYNVMSNCYASNDNTEMVISSQKKSIPFIPSKNRSKDLCRQYIMLADSYNAVSLQDSSIVYSQKAMKLANELKDEQLLSFIHLSIAQSYIGTKDYDLALPFLRKAVANSEIQKLPGTMSQLMNGFAYLYLETKQYDSVYHYANLAIQKAQSMNWNEQLLASYEYLYQSFEQTKQLDNTYKYFRLATALKDSLFDMEKIKSFESISFHEQLKEQERELELAKAEEERQHTIQFALLAIGIISFIIIFLLLSRSMITSTRLIKFLSVVALLMVFEFLNLILHPFLEKVTHHSPVLMLLSLVCIAALLVPLHHKIEHWATHKLVEKNKQIRLAAAKKTIQQLEVKSEH